MTEWLRELHGSSPYLPMFVLLSGGWVLFGAGALLWQWMDNHGK